MVFRGNGEGNQSSSTEYKGRVKKIDCHVTVHEGMGKGGS